MRRTFLLVAVVALAATLFVPATTAAPSTSEHVLSREAAGTWSWVNTGWDVWKTARDGTEYLSGTEDGTWTGTFEGSSSDTFAGEIHSDGSLWGLLSTSFEGTVGGKSGTLEILTTWVVPERNPDAAMTGTWVIINGTDELANLRGKGTWVYEGADPTDHATYSGMVKEFVPAA